MKTIEVVNVKYWEYLPRTHPVFVLRMQDDSTMLFEKHSYFIKVIFCAMEGHVTDELFLYDNQLIFIVIDSLFSCLSKSEKKEVRYETSRVFL